MVAYTANVREQAGVGSKKNRVRINSGAIDISSIASSVSCKYPGSSSAVTVAVTGELEGTAGEESRLEEMGVAEVRGGILEVGAGAPRACDPTDNASWRG